MKKRAALPPRTAAMSLVADAGVVGELLDLLLRLHCVHLMGVVGGVGEGGGADALDEVAESALAALATDEDAAPAEPFEGVNVGVAGAVLVLAGEAVEDEGNPACAALHEGNATLGKRSSAPWRMYETKLMMRGRGWWRAWDAPFR